MSLTKAVRTVITILLCNPGHPTLFTKVNMTHSCLIENPVHFVATQLNENHSFKVAKYNALISSKKENSKINAVVD